MDSPNSGSIQTSSGGDEDYDPRADSISTYMSPITPAAAPPFHHHSTTTMFDPLSNYFDPIPRPPPASLLNLDLVWSKSSRSDPNSGEINPVHPSTSSYQPFFTPQPNHFTSSSPAPQFPTLPENTTPRSTSSSDHTRIGARNPKKRSRASRRAPTTVLTTDTTNFRAMVQEFTGIPAPPFTSSPFPRSRFDLFGAPSNIRSTPLDSPYLFKTFGQKPQQISPFSSPSLLRNAIASTSPNNNNTNTNLSDFTLPKPPPSLGMLNSFIHFEPKYPPESSAQLDPSHTHLKIGGLDEFGLTHGLTHEPPSLDGATRDNPVNWGCGGGGSDGGDQHGNLRGINGNFDYSSSKSTTVKVNYLGSSSNFQGGNKGAENVSSRGEGMLESWICSSD